MWRGLQLGITPGRTPETSYYAWWLCLPWFWESHFLEHAACWSENSCWLESLQVKQTGDSAVGFHSAFISSCNFLPERSPNTMYQKSWFLYFPGRRMAPLITSWDSFWSFKGLHPKTMASSLFLNLTVSLGGVVGMGWSKWDASSAGIFNKVSQFSAVCPFLFLQSVWKLKMIVIHVQVMSHVKSPRVMSNSLQPLGL